MEVNMLKRVLILTFCLLTIFTTKSLAEVTLDVKTTPNIKKTIHRKISSGHKIIVCKGPTVVVYKNDKKTTVGTVYKGEIYTLEKPFISSEITTPDLYYRIKLNTGKKGWIYSKNVNLLTEDYSKDVQEMLIMNYKFRKKLEKASLDELKNILIEVQNNIRGWHYKEPLEYEIIKLDILLAEINKLYLKKPGKPIYELYKDTREFTLSVLRNEKINKIVYSYILCTVVMANPYIVKTNDLLLAETAYRYYPSERSANVFLRELMINTVKIKEKHLKKIIKMMSKKSFQYSDLGRYYNNIMDIKKAFKYLLAAESNAAFDEDYRKNRMKADKIMLAELYSVNGHYKIAALRYLEVSELYGSYEFKAAWNADKAYKKGIKIKKIDRYKTIKLYKKSDSMEGYYNAGLIYAEMDSFRNVRLMASILKNKFNDIEHANILLDKADKIESRIKKPSIIIK